ncbi:hypothetical protein ACFQY0_12345 [Haloferula chungangensis]|uniref:DUF5666 domain-containing protein n=1 Tax=Haloferula chungangensis TaxID=1048331 RepID=A0ABW2L8I7_9BACT
MKGLLVWILTMGMAFGLETAGWRISVDKLVNGGLKNPKVEKLEKAPAESAFFEAGDELWDLSGAVELELWGVVESLRNVDPFAVPEEPWVVDHVGFGGEWLVWNASSGVIVGRTTLAEMALIEDTLDLRSEPFHLRKTIEVGAKAKEKRVSLISRSGEMAKIETESIDLDVATNVDQDLKWLDLQLAVTMDAGESVKEEVQTGVTMKLGQEMKVAAWKDASRDWEMTANAEALTVYGIPVGAVRLIESEGRVVGMGMDRPYDDKRLDGKKLGDGLFVRLFPVPPDFIERITYEPDGKKTKKSAWKLPDMEVPEPLKTSLAGRYIDVSGPLKSNGVRFEHGSAVAGFDPRRSMVLLVNDAENQDMAEAIFACCDGGSLFVVELNFDWEDGACMLLLRSGEKAWIKRTKGEKEVSSLEAAPNVGSDGKVVDLRFFLQTMEGDALNTAVTLAEGVPVEVGSFLKGGVERNVRVTAKVLESGR